MNLHEATKHLHHAAEEHPFAISMLDGTIKDQHWCDWLEAMRMIHAAIDPYVPDYVKRAHTLQHDLMEMMPLVPNQFEVTKNFIKKLDNPVNIGGTAYILLGAHRRGGRVIEKSMKDKGLLLPNNHIHFDDPSNSELYVRQLREYSHLKDGAELAFNTIIEIFDCIIEKGV